MRSKKKERLWAGLNWPDQAPLKEWPNQAALDRILAAVPEHTTPNFDKAQLLTDLRGATHSYLAGVMLREQPSKRRQRGNKIIATARRLKTLLDDGEGPPVTHRPLREYCALLDYLIGDVQTNSNHSLRQAGKLGPGGFSEFEQLVGELQAMFEAHFGISAGYTRSEIDGTVQGIFIDFAAAALKELGITNAGDGFSRRAIERALTKIRHPPTGKTARK
jgi:hypothetical protein